MSWEEVTEIPPWGDAASWNEINRSIRHLVSLYRDRLGEAVETAMEIKAQLELLMPVQDGLVGSTCVECQCPCCTTATVWMDFTDLLYLHLTGQEPPGLQLIEKQTDSCRYHTGTGCILPRLSRPWVCTLYFCPPQLAILRTMDPEQRKKIDDAILAVKTRRKKLEEIFIMVTS
jgi:hypothetical protein